MIRYMVTRLTLLVEEVGVEILPRFHADIMAKREGVSREGNASSPMPSREVQRLARIPLREERSLGAHQRKHPRLRACRYASNFKRIRSAIMERNAVSRMMQLLVRLAVVDVNVLAAGLLLPGGAVGPQAGRLRGRVVVVEYLVGRGAQVGRSLLGRAPQGAGRAVGQVGAVKAVAEGPKRSAGIGVKVIALRARNAPLHILGVRVEATNRAQAVKEGASRRASERRVRLVKPGILPGSPLPLGLVWMNR